MDAQDEKIVLPLELRLEGKKVRLYKPDSPFSPPNPHTHRYTVESDRVYIKHGDFPVYLLLGGSNIVCMGFAKYPWQPRPYCRPGPCGECFSFTVDTGTDSVVVTNGGKPYKCGYRWYLWTAERGKRLEIDPRVYNIGETEPWPPVRKLAVFTRLWRFLTRRALG